jgi:hypothetical protein
MKDLCISTRWAVAVLGCIAANGACGQEYNKTFLSDYSKLVASPLPNNGGTDLIYLQPAAFEKREAYTAVMIDQPEVLMSATSDYNGAKPADLTAIAELFRKDVGDALAAGGYRIVDAPGAGVLYLKSAITDLSLTRKRRPLLAYTPVGFVLKVGVDAVLNMMEKYDITGANVQGEFSDSVSSEELADFVALRGNNGHRMTFDELEKDVKDFASRLRCRLDNTHMPDNKINCLDPEARATREAAHKH